MPDCSLQKCTPMQQLVVVMHSKHILLGINRCCFGYKEHTVSGIRTSEITEVGDNFTSIPGGLQVVACRACCKAHQHQQQHLVHAAQGTSVNVFQRQPMTFYFTVMMLMRKLGNKCTPNCQAFLKRGRGLDTFGLVWSLFPPSTRDMGLGCFLSPFLPFLPFPPISPSPSPP